MTQQNLRLELPWNNNRRRGVPAKQLVWWSEPLQLKEGGLGPGNHTWHSCACLSVWSHGMDVCYAGPRTLSALLAVRFRHRSAPTETASLGASELGPTEEFGKQAFQGRSKVDDDSYGNGGIECNASSGNAEVEPTTTTTMILCTIAMQQSRDGLEVPPSRSLAQLEHKRR